MTSAITSTLKIGYHHYMNKLALRALWFLFPCSFVSHDPLRYNSHFSYAVYCLFTPLLCFRSCHSSFWAQNSCKKSCAQFQLLRAGDLASFFTDRPTSLFGILVSVNKTFCRIASAWPDEACYKQTTGYASKTIIAELPF